MSADTADIMRVFDEYQAVETSGSFGGARSAESAPLSQNQMADIVGAALAGELLFDTSFKCWYTKRGYVWEPCSEIAAKRVAESALKKQRDGFAYAYLIGVFNFLMIRLALEEWTSSTDLLPMANGVLNLASKQLEPAGSRMFNWMLPHEYIEQAACPVIDSWLTQVAEGNQELINFLRAWMYAVLTGRSDLQRYLELVGHGGTGKSTFIRLCIELVGESNSATTDLKSLEQSRFESAALYAKRLAVITDAGSYGGNVDILKAITGQDPVRREQKHKDPESFVYGGMVMIAANEPIQSKDYTSGLSRRRMPVRFDYRVTEADKAKYPNGIEHAMKKEVPALITSLLNQGDSLLEYLRNPTDSILQFKLDAELDTNPLLAWMDSRLIACDTGQEDSRGLMHDDYRGYCADNGYNPVAIARFKGLVVDNAVSRGFYTEARNTKLIRMFTGIRLRRVPDSAVKPFFSGEQVTPVTLVTGGKKQVSPLKASCGAGCDSGDSGDTFKNFHISEGVKRVVSL